MARRKRDQLVTLVEERFLDSASYREPRESMWSTCYQLYMSYAEPLPEEDEDLCNIFIPKTFSDVESITPRVVLGATRHRPWVVVKPRAQDDIERASLVTKLIQAQMDKQQMFMKLVHFFKQALMYGTSPAFIGWRFEERVRRVRLFEDRVVQGINLTQLLGYQQTSKVARKAVVEWDDPWTEVIDLWNFFPDPDGKDIEEMGYIIYREWVSPQELEHGKEVGLYDQIEQAINTQLRDTEPRPSEERMQSVGLAGSRAGKDRTRPIELLHMWEEDRVVTVANRAVVIRNASGDDYPYFHGRKPFVAVIDTPIPGEFYGYGMVQAMKDLQEELNTVRRQRRDHVSLSVHQMFVASRNANINPRDLIWRPGGVIWVDDLQNVNNVLQPIKIPDVTQASFLEEDRLQRDIEQTNAIADFYRGQLSAEGKTATEIMQAAAGASARVEMKVRVMAELGLKETARHFLELNRQFVTKERVVRLLGGDREDEWITVRPGDLQMPYDDLIPAAASVESWANKVAVRQDLLRLMQILGRAPVFLQYMDVKKLLLTLMDTFDFAEVEQFILDVDPRQLVAQQLLQGLTGGQLPGLPGGATSGGPALLSGETKASPMDLMAPLQKGIGSQGGGS